MEITNELRNSMTYDITTAPSMMRTVSIDIVEFNDLCDAIDSVHANLEREYERLREQDRDGWIELPKDKDGEYIHIGDMMKSPSGYVEMVEGILPDRYLVIRDGKWFVCHADWGRHYHAPTVEDVLAEMFAKAIERGELTNGAERTIAEYAKRLTLAGDAE